VVFAGTPADMLKGDTMTARFLNGKEKIEVRCADGIIHIHSMQMAGKRRMTNKELLLGLRDIAEYRF
jgi:methionyl-tRNA formyltransferase